MERIHTTKEVGLLLGISEQMVRRYLRSGQIHGIKIGRLWRIRGSDLQEMFQKKREQEV